MTKFKFKGVGDQDEITFRGKDFAKGKAVVVDCEDLAAKLRALDYFEEVRPATRASGSKKGAGHAENEE